MRGNSGAGWLAKHGSSMGHGVHLWKNNPSTILSSLLTDALRIARLDPNWVVSVAFYFLLIKKEGKPI